MSDRTPMSIDEFDLFVRAMHREFVKDPDCIDVVNDSTFYKGTENKVFFTHSINSGDVWVTVSNKEFTVSRPGGWFNTKNKKQFAATMAILDIVRSGDPDMASCTEELICKAIPSAKDIIAEKALVGDHGNETGNSSS